MAKSSTGSGGKKGKKNRKHNRHKLRSPAQKAYIIESRSKKNKMKRLNRHCENNPTDFVNISNKDLLECGKPGKMPDYKLQVLKPEEQKELRRQREWKLYLRRG